MSSILDSSNQFDRRISGVWGYSQFLQHSYYVIWCTSMAAWHHLIFAVVPLLNHSRGPLSAQRLLCYCFYLKELQWLSHNYPLMKKRFHSREAVLGFLHLSNYHIIATSSASLQILQMPDEFPFYIQIPQTYCSLACVSLLLRVLNTVFYSKQVVGFRIFPGGSDNSVDLHAKHYGTVCPFLWKTGSDHQTVGFLNLKRSENKSKKML